MPVHSHSPQAIESHFGCIGLDRSICMPLERLRLSITGRVGGDARCLVQVCDPLQRRYVELEVELVNNHGEVTFAAAGVSGAHYVYLHFPKEARWSRYLNFTVVCESEVRSGDPDFDFIYSFTRDQMRQGRREYLTPSGKFVGYISADTLHFDGIWLRDWIYGMPAYRHWERDLACGVDRFLARQADNGMIPDGIERDGSTWRVGLESDVEYIMVLAVWQTWQATGDSAWLQAALPRLEKALQYVFSDPKHWDATHNLVKRQHSCDTWDFDIDGASDKGDHRHVIATCDQAGYFLAFKAMSQMYAALGDHRQSGEWGTYAVEYRQRAVNLLWDGVKFRHHVHLDPIGHGDFDEEQQLAMGNTWAMTRGLATPEQARSIVDEYHRRQIATGDAYPWWSLQPGYPDHLGYFHKEYCQQGGYANGGLMPWVGGELCLGALQYGRETYGVELLRQYSAHLRQTGGVQVWYWPDGEPGFRTHNEVRYAGWGMAQWAAALFEGLAGVRDLAAGLRRVQVAPRWAAAGLNEVFVVVAYASSGACFCYDYHWDEPARTLTLEFSGSGEEVEFHLLLPVGWEAVSLRVNHAETIFQSSNEDASQYVDFHAVMAGVNRAELLCHPVPGFTMS